MKRKAQGNAIVWGAGCLMVAFGAVLMLLSLKERTLGSPDVGLVEGFLGVVLLVFGIVSFYMAHK